MPGGGVGLQVQSVQLLDRPAEQVADAAVRLAFGQQIQQRPQLGRITLGEDGADGLGPQPGIVPFLDDLPTGREAQFQAEAASELS